jgi:hypothetical protein
MKKVTLLLGMLTITQLSPVFAEGCDTLYVNINNQSPADCVLEKQYLIHGKLPPTDVIPQVIFRNQEAQFKMMGVVDSDELDVLLTYQCGDEQTISFYTRKPESKSIRPRRGIPLYFFTADNSTVVESKNITAKFTSELCNTGAYWYSEKPNKVNWIISSSENEPEQ